ncbi:hypothetical protein IEO21_07291 [Rhodonia placenta]|uniref:Uncharacterized protein n=1 Tax=Rhodonia placenta TaxID=104341 RepID=A0A8H7U0G9_9APHY|nr:hypothetical protein IEO21_07291 [Postia placenta]
MPTPKVPSAFLDLVGTNRDLWTWEPWIDFTGLSDAPWSGKPGSKPKGWTDDDVVSVRAMVNAYWTVAPKDRMVFFKDRKGGAKGKSKASFPPSAADLGALHTDARNKWSAWFNELGREQLAKLVDNKLMEEGHHPTQLMKANATQKMPTMAAAMVTSIYVDLAEELFGRDALLTDTVVKSEVITFFNALLYATWRRWTMVVSRQKVQLASKLDAVRTRWFELSANEENVTVFRLTQFFQTVTRVLELTEALSDKTAEDEMNVLKSDLQSMLSLISSGPDSSGETKPLPKSIRTALLKLASQPQVESVRGQIMAIINDEQPEVVALDFESLPEGTWKEGTEDVEDDALENGFSKVVDAMMVDVRARYDGYVVRRTLGSLDWEGKAISGLPPYAEHVLMLKLTGEEYRNLDTIANEAAELNPGGSIAYNSGKSFYLSVRRALLHPSCNAEYKWTMPTSREEWEATATAKISALITILKYHLEQDGRPPLVSVPVEDPSRPQSPSSDTSSDEPAAYEERPANNLAPDPDAQPDPRDAHSKPDKIVVYVAFPSCFDPLLKILQMYGIENTSDVFLNNISFDKSIMHNAFMGSSRALRRVFDPKYDLDVGDKDLTHEEEPQELPDVQGASGSASAQVNIPFLAEDFSSAGQQQADPEPQPKQSAKAKREAARAAKKQLEQQERLDARREKEQREREHEEQQEAQVAKRDKRERQRETRERKKLAAEQAQSSQAPSASGSRRARKVVPSDAEDDEDISAQKVRSPPKGASGSRFDVLATYAHASDLDISSESTDDETRTQRLLFEPREESTSTSAVSGTLHNALEKFTLDAAVQDDVEPVPAASAGTQSQQRSEFDSGHLVDVADDVCLGRHCESVLDAVDIGPSLRAGLLDWCEEKLDFQEHLAAIHLRDCLGTHAAETRKSVHIFVKDDIREEIQTPRGANGSDYAIGAHDTLRRCVAEDSLKPLA